jgi:hypothetical protein
VQAAIVEPPLLGRQLFQAASQILVSWSPGTIANGLSIGVDQAARRSLISYQPGDCGTMVVAFALRGDVEAQSGR